MPMTGIEDGVEENGLDTNEKLAPSGRFLEHCTQVPSPPWEPGKPAHPFRPNHGLLTAVTEKGLGSFKAS